MSTTSRYADPTPTTDTRTRTGSGAPQMFSTTNRTPLPPAFGEEEWANGGP